MLHIFRDYFFLIRDKRIFPFFSIFRGVGMGVAVEVILEDFVSEIV